MRRRPYTPKPDNHGFGSYTAGCRCDVCREAKAAYERDRRAGLKKRGRSDLRPRVVPPVLKAGWVAPRVEDLAWQDSAACLTADPETFFRDGDEGKAKAICEACPVKSECRSLAARIRPSDGVWAGEVLAA